jgi:hypothetical protein
VTALVTTFMAGPLIELIYPKRISDREPAAVATEVPV